LIVAVVNHHGTPVEISIGGEQANAGSILEVMILSGSQADARKVTFKGDARPLEDLRELLEAGAGEQGLAHFSENLGYLRG
jgi:phosphotransferase system HPr-like phosphotransfer protein